MNIFFINLFSNDSIEIFNENTLAAFTNKFNKLINLGNANEWEVGLSEISLNDFSSPIKTVGGTTKGVTKSGPLKMLPKKIKKFKTSELYSTDSDSLSLSDSETVSECCLTKRKLSRRKKHVKIAKISKEDEITIGSNFLKITKDYLNSIAYTKKDINFGKFLETFDECIQFTSVIDKIGTKSFIRNKLEHILNDFDYTLPKKIIKKEKDDYYMLFIFIKERQKVIMSY